MSEESRFVIRPHSLFILTPWVLAACSAVSPMPKPGADVRAETPTRTVAHARQAESSERPATASVMPGTTPPAPRPAPAAESVADATPSDLTPAPIHPVDPAGTWLLQWHEEFRGLSAEALQREAARGPEAGRAHEGVGPSGQTVRWALALWQTRGSAELLKAQAALEQVSRASTAEAQHWRPWARWLLARVQEQRRLEDLIDRQNQQIKEQQRRIDTLQDKLEALKAIERSLGPRTTPPPGAPARPKAP